jgi:riboflavin synthase
MFTGIIETLGTIISSENNGTNRSFWVESPLSKEFKPDQSVSHNGICLTVEEVKENRHRVTAVHETLQKTTAGTWETGQIINLERCLLLSARLDGHLVQGHVDTKAICLRISEFHGSWEYEFEFEKNAELERLIVEKGSISLNGISLTIFNIQKNRFSVAIIPYTFEHTSIHFVKPGHQVNIEFDIIGKYILRNQQVLNYT